MPRYVRNKLKDNIVGKRFGNLLVLEYVGQKLEIPSRPYGVSTFLCKCDCGVIKEIRGSNLTRKKLSTKSCGCRSIEFLLKAILKPHGVASFNFLLSSYKSQARVRGHEFLLSEDEFRNLTSSNCHYCGVEPRQYPKSYKKKGIRNGDYLYNGLDRKDNTAGYTINNVVPCCWSCNNLKKAIGYDDFLYRVQRISDNMALKGLVTA